MADPAVPRCLVIHISNPGFIQEIGPYILPDGVNYKKDDPLVENPHSWNKASNLLFIESPAGVGYSYNLNKEQ